MNADDVERLAEEIEWGAFPDKAERHAALGRDLAPEEYGRATFLTMAADHWLMAGELAQARRALEDVGRPHPGELLLDPLVHWIALALAEDAVPDVDRLLALLLAQWRADLLHPASCCHVAELLETHDDLRRAHRWFTLPLRDVDPDDTDDLDRISLVGRRRVRRALGLPLDRYDAVAVRELGPEV